MDARSEQAALTGQRRLAGVALAALGVVFGDIGTSPLYAIRECFGGSHAVPVSRESVLGVLSLVVWSLIVVVSVKYLAFVMRADNRGEGGVLALLAVVRSVRVGRMQRRILLPLGLFGAALLYGDGIITPAISVLSAVEGLGVAAPGLSGLVLPITVGILLALFAVQFHGTARVGAVFGPVTLVWFLSIAALGIASLVRELGVVAALNPAHGVRFFASHGARGFAVLGAVLLVVTGSEALYADMGHFGRRPIRSTWFVVVLPALLLNYFGQGALLLRDPAAVENPFYLLVPEPVHYPMVVLATSAAVIASQAMISGTFSLARQAVQLGYSPRLTIVHTSAATIGQIYMPSVNWALMIACIGLVLGFGSSSAMAGAYGVAVASTMLITTVLAFVVAREVWRWPLLTAGLLAGALLAVDLAFFGASLLKIVQGGWFPLLVAAAAYVLMSTWNDGRGRLEKLLASSLPLEQFLAEVRAKRPPRVPGTAVVMTRTGQGTPVVLLHHLKHNKVLHQRVVLLTVVSEEVPYVPAAERVSVEEGEEGFWRVQGRYGFLEHPSVPEVLEACRPHGLEFRSMETTFILGRESLLTTGRTRMARWRKALFAFMARNSRSATSFFGLPPNRVVELGAQIEL